MQVSRFVVSKCSLLVLQSAFHKELPFLTKKRCEQQVSCSWQLSYLASLVLCICADGSYPR
jgi:hypothetical protein